jgi:hypothetical protein
LGGFQVARQKQNDLAGWIALEEDCVALPELLFRARDNDARAVIE